MQRTLALNLAGRENPLSGWQLCRRGVMMAKLFAPASRRDAGNRKPKNMPAEAIDHQPDSVRRVEAKFGLQISPKPTYEPVFLDRSTFGGGQRFRFVHIVV